MDSPGESRNLYGGAERRQVTDGSPADVVTWRTFVVKAQSGSKCAPSSGFIFIQVIDLLFKHKMVHYFHDSVVFERRPGAQYPSATSLHSV